MRLILAGVSVAVLAVSLPAPRTAAQTSEQTTWCTEGGTPDQAIDGCTAMIKSRKYRGDKLSAIYNRRGNAYLLKRDFDHAIEDYNQALMYDISNSDLMYNRGLALFRKGDIEKAIPDFDRAIARFDANRYPVSYKRDYFKARGNAWSGKGDFDRAIADYDEAIKLDPKFARAYYNRGVAKQKKGDTEGSEADIAKAKQIQADIGPGE